MDAEQADPHRCPGLAEHLGRAIGRKARYFVKGFRYEQSFSNTERNINTYIAPRVSGILSELREVHEKVEILNQIQGVVMAQVEELRSAVIENAAAAEEAILRVNAKLAELGEPDADLTADIELIRQATAQIKSIADPATPDPGDEGFEPGPVVGQPEAEEAAPAEADAERAEEGNAGQSANG